MGAVRALSLLESDSPLGILLGFVAGVGLVLCAWFLMRRRREPGPADLPQWDEAEERRLFDGVSSRT